MQFTNDDIQLAKWQLITFYYIVANTKAAEFQKFLRKFITESGSI